MSTISRVAGRLGLCLPPLPRDALIWWHLTSEFLLELVSHAGFTSHQQKLSLEFYYRFVVPNLGPPLTSIESPNLWKSFMTDDFTPIEFSWDWGNADSMTDRRVRLSVEPISYNAGTFKDPFNATASYELLHELSKTLKDLDLQWFHWLSGKMMADAPKVCPVTPTYHASLSSVFLGFELGEPKPLVKAYLLPSSRNHPHERVTSSIVCRTLRAFASEISSEMLADLVNFLETEGTVMQLSPVMIAIDCITQEPRIKVYMRSPDTSFASVRNLLSRFEEPTLISNGLEELRDLWTRMFDLDDNFDFNSQLRPNDHQTSGILYYLEVRPNSRKVTSKVYLPVRHYGTNDWSIALGLTNFFKARKRIQANIADQYLAALRAVCNHRRLDRGRGMHTYIAATVKNNSLHITSYLKPEIYRRKGYGDMA